MSSVIGFWYFTWKAETPPEGTNMSLAFSGYADIDDALSSSMNVRDKLVGKKYLTVGGGEGATDPTAGHFNTARVEKLTEAIKAGRLAGYDGIAYDIEICDEAGLSDLFATSFAEAKANNLEVLVTVSHSQPYGCPDAQAMMQAFFADSNIDYLSPQLYSSGYETEPDCTAVGTSWHDYADSKGKVIPSINNPSFDSGAMQKCYEGSGVTLDGYIYWPPN